MTINVSIHLRGEGNVTNTRARALGRGLHELSGVRVRYLKRNDVDPESDLIVQTGFAGTRALNRAVSDRKPYIIMELPNWRPDLEYTTGTASFGYNGLGGLAWHPPIPTQSRPKPVLQPLKTSGETIVFAQKPNDHSLRGANHVKWVEDMLKLYPEATLRHHPIMMQGKSEPLARVLDRCKIALTYTSTVGVEAKVAGCDSEPSDAGSMAWDVTNRGKWLHELSWKQFSFAELETQEIAGWIFSGYEEAAERAAKGILEVPRSKLDNRQMIEYHRRFGNEQ